MYSPNEYYRPYNPRTTRDRPRDRQRVPPEYVTKGRGKPPSFPLLETPPPPPSLPTHSSLATSVATSSSLLPSQDKSECYCRLSSLVKGTIFLLILLGATCGLVLWFLNHNSAAQEIFKDTPPNVASDVKGNVNAKVPTKFATNNAFVRDRDKDVQTSDKYNEVAVNFPATEGEEMISPTPRIIQTVTRSSTLEKIVDGTRHFKTTKFELIKNKVVDDTFTFNETNQPKHTLTDGISDELKESQYLENIGNNITDNEGLKKDVIEGESVKKLFDDIDVKTSELSFTKDKLINKSSFSDSKDELLTIPLLPLDTVEEADVGQINEANFNEFKLDKYVTKKDDNESPTQTIDGTTTTTTIAPIKDIIDNKKQEVGDLNADIPSSINTGDNEFFTSDYEEKEVFPTSSLLNESSLSETLAAMDEQILGELNFI